MDLLRTNDCYGYEKISTNTQYVLAPPMPAQLNTFKENRHQTPRPTFYCRTISIYRLSMLLASGEMIYYDKYAPAGSLSGNRWNPWNPCELFVSQSFPQSSC